MTQVSLFMETHTTEQVLRQLDRVNEWLNDVYGPNTRLSTLLSEAGASQEQIETLKSKYLAPFLQSFIEFIENLDIGLDATRRSRIMIRHYGLHTGKAETLTAIGESMHLSRERIRQLVKKRLSTCRSKKFKTILKDELLLLANDLLSVNAASPKEA